jgi:hypothetical protein
MSPGIGAISTTVLTSRAAREFGEDNNQERQMSQTVADVLVGVLEQIGVGFAEWQITEPDGDQSPNTRGLKKPSQAKGERL